MKPIRSGLYNGGVLPRLKVMPTFQPQPFRQDKFLSIKSRSAGFWVDTCRDIISRSSNLERKINEYFNLNATSNTNESVSLGSVQEQAILKPEVCAHVGALPSHFAEELHHINKKAQRLSTMQGFVLTDELVFDMFHLNIMKGDCSTALALWLQTYILGDEQRGPPYPYLFLEDLVTILEAYLMTRLPQSEANFHFLSTFPTQPDLYAAVGEPETFHTLLEHGWRLPQPERWSDSAGWFDKKIENKKRDWYTSLLYANSYNRYTHHYLTHYFIPVWRTAGKLNLFFDELRENARLSSIEAPEEEEDMPEDVMHTSGQIQVHKGLAGYQASPVRTGAGDILPSLEKQNAAVRRLLMSFVPTKFATTDEGDLKKCLMPLHGITQLLVALAECAAEVKEPWFLLLLQTAFCTGFLRRGDTGSTTEQDIDSNEGCILLNTGAWIGYLDELDADARAALVPHAQDILTQFSLDIISLVNYGRHAFRSEQQLWAAHDALCLISAALQQYQGSSVLATARSAGMVANESHHSVSEEDHSFNCPQRFVDVLWRIVSSTVSAAASSTHYVESESNTEREGEDESRAQARLWDETSALVKSYISGLRSTTKSVTRAMLYVAAGCQDFSILGDEDFRNGTLEPSCNIVESAKQIEPDEETEWWSAMERTLVLQNLRFQVRLAWLCSADANSPVNTAPEVDTQPGENISLDEWMQELRKVLNASNDTDVRHHGDQKGISGLNLVHVRGIVDSLVERLVCLTLIDLAHWLRRYDGRQPRGNQAIPTVSEKKVRVTGPFLSHENENETYDLNEDLPVYNSAGEKDPHYEALDVDHNHEDGASVNSRPVVYTDEASLLKNLSDLHVSRTLQHRIELLLDTLKLGISSRVGTLSSSISWHTCVSPSAVSVLAVLLAGCPIDCGKLREASRQVLYAIWEDLVEIATHHLSLPETNSPKVLESRQDQEAMIPPSSLFGNSLGILLLMLARTAQWKLVKRLLQGMEASDGQFPASGKDRSSHPESPAQNDSVRWQLSSVTMDPELFSEVFRRARESGETTVCAMLSAKRKYLFF